MSFLLFYYLVAVNFYNKFFIAFRTFSIENFHTKTSTNTNKVRSPDEITCKILHTKLHRNDLGKAIKLLKPNYKHQYI